MWTIGIAKTGNELGLSAAEVDALAPAELQTRLERARARFRQEGAHYVVDSIRDVPAILDELNTRLAKGERP
jgi:phosphonoacetaldehyde hydrolase